MRRRKPEAITAMSRLIMPLFLREADVKALLTMDLVLAALDQAFREWAGGRAVNQPRRRVAGGAVLATTSAALPSAGRVGFKAYTVGRVGAAGGGLQAGQPLNVCGSNFPDRREVDGPAVGRAELVVADDVEAARLEAGDLLLAEREGQLSWARVHSLREVVAGTAGSRQPSDVSLFKSVGLAIEDVAVGAAVLQLAETQGVGLRLPD